MDEDISPNVAVDECVGASCSCICEGNIEGMTLAAVCDGREARREMCLERFENIALFTDYREMIASGLIDAVIIAVPFATAVTLPSSSTVTIDSSPDDHLSL